MKTPASPDRLSVTVIGAGAVGMACACYLQREGHEVTVIDRLGPGEACSFGNSGGLAASHVEPLGTPGVFLQVPGWLIDPLGPLRLRWAHLPHMFPFLIRLLRASTPGRMRVIAETQASLVRGSYDAWKPLIKDADLGGEILHRGAINVYPSEQAREQDMGRWNLQRELGLSVESLDEDELRQLEPALVPAYRSAVLQPEWRRVRDPYRIVEGLAIHFQREGGTILREIVSEIQVHGQADSVAVRTNRSLRPTQRVVVAAGAWSHRISAALGSPVPLESGRGYNVTLNDPGLEFEHLVIARGKVKFTLASLSVGLRVGGALEFAGVDAAPDYRRAKAALESVTRVFPHVNTKDHAMWCGDRPMTPDTIPVISQSPRHPDVFYAFGHGHLGLTMAGITGKLITELVSGRSPSLDLGRMRVDRF